VELAKERSCFHFRLFGPEEEWASFASGKIRRVKQDHLSSWPRMEGKNYAEAEVGEAYGKI
jgi:hypothetical protein